MTEERRDSPFCALPFASLQLQPTGHVAPCCFNQGLVLGEIGSQSLREIWNGNPMRVLRREFLEGSPRSCAQQIRHIGCNRHHRALESQVVRAEVQELPPRKLDVRLNGKCNLECVMCGVWQQPNGLYDAAGFWEEGPREIFPHLLEIDVLGGEPFIQKDTYRLIDEISRINPRCTWYFATNAQWKLTPGVRSRLDLIPIRMIHVSLDSLDAATYARIRKKGELARALETFADLAAYRERREREGRGFLLLATFCIQRENWREIPEMSRFARRWGARLVYQFAYEPGYVSLATLPARERREILAFLEAHQGEIGAEQLAPISLPLRESLAGGGDPALSSEGRSAPAPS